MTKLETQLHNALLAIMNVKHRVSGCNEPSCLVCKENHAIFDQAQEALAQYTIQEEKRSKKK